MPEFGAPLPSAMSEVPASAVVVPISRLLANARLVIERSLGVLWVSGEVSNLYRAPSGHVYFVLKDADGQARCTLWRQKAQRLDFPLRDGLAVEVRAAPSLYEAKGEFQLNVDAVRLAGLGALYERFAKLRVRLADAGWFAAERKRPLPRYPRAIGVVTSPRGAALRDVLTTLRRRWPAARIVVYPAAVQGAAAAPELDAAIRSAGTRGDADVLIVCRGGGSIEDLWPFNEEVVARAILDSPIPVVTGIGHETDFTICDFVADARAPTPTGAAAMVVPDRSEFEHRLQQLAQRLWRAEGHALAQAVQRTDIAARRLVHPAARIEAQRKTAADLGARLARAWQRQAASHVAMATTARARLLRELRAPSPQQAALARAGERLVRCQRLHVERLAGHLRALGAHLVHLNPKAVLERGYAIVTTAGGAIVQDSRQLNPGDDVALAFAQGAADARITGRK
jgi:exodeoxyribonuclease VII large subunit